MRDYGYLFGVLKLIKDTHHDEVYIEKWGIVVAENNHWRHTYSELVAIAREQGINPFGFTIIDYGDL